MSAMTIVSMVIGYLRNHALELLRPKTYNLVEKEVGYVISISDVASDHAKHLIKTAGIKVTI